MGGVAALWLAAAAIAAGCASVDPMPSESPSAEPSVSEAPTATPDKVAPTILVRDRGRRGDCHRWQRASHVQRAGPGVDDARFGYAMPPVPLCRPPSRSIQLARRDTVPHAGLTVATVHRRAGRAIRDDAGNLLPPSSWHVTSASDVTFAAGTYTAYRFDEATGSIFVAIRRATLAARSGGTRPGTASSTDRATC